MGTLKVAFSQFDIDRLKLKLLKKIGWAVSTKPDCAKLSDIINKSGSGHISESTLYRIFFQFEKHKPYKHTLDILCQFLDYKDSNHFKEEISESRQQLHLSGINTLTNKSNGLLYYSIQHTAKNPLLDFFEETSELNYEFKLDVSVAVLDALLKSTQQDWFFKEFTTNKNKREYFYEQVHDTKFRINNYDKAYIKYLESVIKKNSL
jgi:hypothetical protein